MEDWEDRPEDGNDRGVTLTTEIHVGWNNENVILDVVSKVAARIYDDIKPQVSQAILDAVNNQVNLAVVELMDNEIQPTDRWGKPQGVATSIRELLQRDAEAWLTEQVDEYGRYGSDSFGKRFPRIHYLFKQALNGDREKRGKTIGDMIAQAIKDTIGDVEAVVNATVREHVKKAMK